MLNTQFSPWPAFSEEEADAVKKVLLSNRVNYWTGKECRKFEEEYAKWVGCKYAVAVANGTLALELALKALGIGRDDDVIVPSRTFIASALAVIACGAKPIFCDIDLESQNISAEQIQKVITPSTKAVIVVHLAGMPAEMGAIMEMSAKYKFYVVEDCAQAHGAKYKGRSVGSIGHVGAWSFCQDKIISTGGEGGMVTTNDKKLWSKMWSYKDHGKDYDEINRKSEASGFRWLHSSVGSNFRMTEMQAVIGRIQLKKIDNWLETRRSNALAIYNIAKDFKLVRQMEASNDFQSAFYKYYIFVNNEYLAKGWSRDLIIKAINELGVPCYSGSCPEIYLEKVFINLDLQPINRFENAQELGETSLMFLVHPSLTQKEVQKACTILAHVLDKAQKKDIDR